VRSRDGGGRALAGAALGGLLLAGCAGSAAPGVQPTQATGADPRPQAYARLISRLRPFEVSGAVHSDRGDLLPESISIEVRSEICVESRPPGARFWSLDYDTCFAWVARDSVKSDGSYRVSVPSLEADEACESREGFGELRLVQKGPVTFLAESDAGWKLQNTFASSHSQRRDLVLDMKTDRFWVVSDQAQLRIRPAGTAEVCGRFRFGDPVEVVRFHEGWAECLTAERIGWMEMGAIGTEEEMKTSHRESSPPPTEDPPGSGASR
jgi:hypothetical protein